MVLAPVHSSIASLARPVTLQMIPEGADVQLAGPRQGKLLVPLPSVPANARTRIFVRRAGQTAEAGNFEYIVTLLD